jgi:hypothetical protein
MKLIEYRIEVTLDRPIPGPEWLQQLEEDIAVIATNYLTEMKNELEAPEFGCKVKMSTHSKG